MKKKLIQIFLAAVLTLSPVVALADDLKDLNSLIDYYAAQSKEKKDKILTKQQEAQLIQNQISQVSSEINSAEQAITSTSSQINDVQGKIDDLSDKIKDQEYSLATEKDRLGGLLSSWYMEGEDDFFEAMLSSSSVSELMDKHQYYDSVKQQMEGTVTKIEALKKDLIDQKATEDRKAQDLAQLKKNQADQKAYLESRKNLKVGLLNNTSKTISGLKDEKEDIDAKIAEVQKKIDQIRASSVANGQIVSSNDPSWYFSQLDARWKDDPLGSYKYDTIGNVGCLLTSLTMVAKFYGKNYTPKTAAEASSFVQGGRNDGALISTPIVDDDGSQSINWSTVDNELAAGHPVVVGVALGVDMGNSYGVSHFVVVKSKMSDGRYAMHDPLGDGRGYYLSQIKAMRIIRP